MTLESRPGGGNRSYYDTAYPGVRKCYLSAILSRDELVDPNVFETANAGFAQAMYEEFLRDPAAVGPEWRRLFESGVVGERDGREAGKRGSGEAGERQA